MDGTSGETALTYSEIDAIRKLLGSKPRPVGWSERRQRLNEVGSTWPVASDVKCETVDCDGAAGEWSIVPGSEPSRVLLYFHGGGYCSGSIVSHRRLVTEAGRAAGTRTLAWDGRDTHGTLTPAGVYFLNLRAGERTWRERVVRIP